MKIASWQPRKHNFSISLDGHLKSANYYYTTYSYYYWISKILNSASDTWEAVVVSLGTRIVH